MMSQSIKEFSIQMIIKMTAILRCTRTDPGLIITLNSQGAYLKLMGYLKNTVSDYAVITP